MFRPAYLSLPREDLHERARQAVATLADCRACPRDCRVNRLEDKYSACKTGRYAVVSSHFPHFGEEDCLRGWNGSGTIFFSHCNLRCIFCFHPDTLIPTDEGLRRIADIFERSDDERRDGRVRFINGDARVVTREGRWAPVTKVFRHHFAGDLIRLKPYHCPPLLLTPNHEVFVVPKADLESMVKVPAGQLNGEHYLIVPKRTPAGKEITLNLSEKRHSRWKETRDYFLVPIHKMERAPYDGPVFNIEVDDPDHSYLAPYVAVGNCQNYDISQAIKPGKEDAPKGSPPEVIAGMMLELQEIGCHNVNFVTPEHVVPQVLEAVAVAVEYGLKVPIIYNTSAYDSMESLAFMDGIVDVYMPDFKYWSAEASRTYMKAENYPEAAKAAIKEMHRQVGDLIFDADGLAQRGLLIRHLVMPGNLDETRAILEWIATELGPNTYVNLMDQYYPAGKVSAVKYPEINRRLHPEEFREAQHLAREVGLRRLDARRPHPRLLRRSWTRF